VLLQWARKMDMEESKTFSAVAPHPFVSAFVKSSQMGKVKTTQIARTDAGLLATIEESGQERKLEKPSVEFRLADALGMDLWLKERRRAACGPDLE